MEQTIFTSTENSEHWDDSTPNLMGSVYIDASGEIGILSMRIEPNGLGKAVRLIVTTSEPARIQVRSYGPANKLRHDVTLLPIRDWA